MRHYPHMPTDYRHTDKQLRLVMTLFALYCTRHSRAPNFDHCAPEIWPWPWPLTLTLMWGKIDVKTQFLTFDLWPTTLTNNPSLAKVKVKLHTKYQGRRSNSSSRRTQTLSYADDKKTSHNFKQKCRWILYFISIIDIKLRGHLGVQKHYRATWTILTTKYTNVLCRP